MLSYVNILKNSLQKEFEYMSKNNIDFRCTILDYKDGSLYNEQDRKKMFRYDHYGLFGLNVLTNRKTLVYFIKKDFIMSAGKNDLLKYNILKRDNDDGEEKYKIPEQSFSEIKEGILDLINNYKSMNFVPDPMLKKACQIIYNKRELYNNREIIFLLNNDNSTAMTIPIPISKTNELPDINLWDSKPYPILISIGRNLENRLRYSSKNDEERYQTYLRILLHEMGHNFDSIKLDDIPYYPSQYVGNNKNARVPYSNNRYDQKKLNIEFEKQEKFSNDEKNKELIRRDRIGETRADMYSYDNAKKYDSNIDLYKSGELTTDFLKSIIVPMKTLEYRLKNNIRLDDKMIAKTKEELNTIKTKLEYAKNNKGSVDISTVFELMKKIAILQSMLEERIRMNEMVKDRIPYTGKDTHASLYYRNNVNTGKYYKQKEYKPTQQYDHREYYDDQKNKQEEKLAELSKEFWKKK